jgi:hypothetical protein
MGVEEKAKRKIFSIVHHQGGTPLYSPYIQSLGDELLRLIAESMALAKLVLLPNSIDSTAATGEITR